MLGSIAVLGFTHFASTLSPHRHHCTPQGLGILAVSGVPTMGEKRQRLLPLSRRFANLPSGTKAKYVHPQSFYSFGWSHGKEKLAGGRPDVTKGSFYNNPTTNRPFDDEDIIAEYPSVRASSIHGRHAFTCTQCTRTAHTTHTTLSHNTLTHHHPHTHPPPSFVPMPIDALHNRKHDRHRYSGQCNHIHLAPQTCPRILEK